MKTSALACVLTALALALMAGCAVVEPKEFMALQGQVSNQQRQITQLRQQVDGLSQQMERSRKPTAELTAQVTTLRQEIMRLSGRLEEMDHRLGQAPKAGDLQAATKDLSAKTDKAQKAQQEVNKRLARLEDYLGLQGKSGQAPPPGKRPAPPPPPPPKPQDTYELGIRLYKQKSYQAARDQFSGYIKQYPKSKRAAGAQYWIGETYYAQKKYEEAILAYNQVIKRYAKSSLVPSALLKQGLAFRALGDKRTARIVLNKLVKEYSKTSQAKLARKILRKL